MIVSLRTVRFPGLWLGLLPVVGRDPAECVAADPRLTDEGVWPLAFVQPEHMDGCCFERDGLPAVSVSREISLFSDQRFVPRNRIRAYRAL